MKPILLPLLGAITSLGSVPIPRRPDAPEPFQGISKADAEKFMGGPADEPPDKIGDYGNPVQSNDYTFTCTNDFGYPARRYNAPGQPDPKTWADKSKQAKRESRAMRKGRR